MRQPELDLNLSDYEDGLQQLSELEDRMWISGLDEWYRHSSLGLDRQPWRVIPFNRLKLIWNLHARSGIVRDCKGLRLIIDILTENVCKIWINTVIMERCISSPAEYINDRYILDRIVKDGDFDGYENWCIDPESKQWRISDFACGVLKAAAAQLLEARQDRRKIMYADRILQATHMRGDIASWFVEGGCFSLSELSS